MPLTAPFARHAPTTDLTLWIWNQGWRRCGQSIRIPVAPCKASFSLFSCLPGWLSSTLRQNNFLLIKVKQPPETSFARCYSCWLEFNSILHRMAHIQRQRQTQVVPIPLGPGREKTLQRFRVTVQGLAGWGNWIFSVFNIACEHLPLISGKIWHQNYIYESNGDCWSAVVWMMLFVFPSMKPSPDPCYCAPSCPGSCLAASASFPVSNVGSLGWQSAISFGTSTYIRNYHHHPFQPDDKTKSEFSCKCRRGSNPQVGIFCKQTYPKNAGTTFIVPTWFHLSIGRFRPQILCQKVWDARHHWGRYPLVQGILKRGKGGGIQHLSPIQ